MNQDDSAYVTVFSTGNNALFQMAKSLLENARIPFYPSGDTLNTLNPAVYTAEIKVAQKDAEEADKLLRGLQPAERNTGKTPNQKAATLLIMIIVLILGLAGIVVYLFMMS